MPYSRDVHFFDLIFWTVSTGVRDPARPEVLFIDLFSQLERNDIYVKTQVKIIRISAACGGIIVSTCRNNATLPSGMSCPEATSQSPKPGQPNEM
jgi:hypothetical protein